MPVTGSGKSPAGNGCCVREWIVEDLNRFLRGWAGYFRYGNSGLRRPDQELSRMRLALWLRKATGAPGGRDR